MFSLSRVTRLAAWLGLLFAGLALGLYRLGFDALGVVLDTRPIATALALFALLLTFFGFSARRSRRTLAARLAVGLPAFALASLTLTLLVADTLRLGRTEEIAFVSNELTFAGTLYLPGTGAPPYPAIIITHGAGEATRDEGRFYARLFARNGIASLVYDKRGSGQSAGDLNVATYQDLAADAIAAVRYLMGRQEIDDAQIGLWGVSEGGWVLPIVAATAREVAFLIVVSTTAESPAEQTQYEVGELVKRAGYDVAAVERARALYAELSAFERTGQGYDKLATQLQIAAHEPWFNAAAYLPVSLPDFATLTRRSWYPAWRVNMDFDAPAYWRQVRCPVLLLLGGSDPKLDAAKAVRQIPVVLLEGGNAAVTVHLFPHAEHGLVEWWLPGRLPPPRFPTAYPLLMPEWVLAVLHRPDTKAATG